MTKRPTFSKPVFEENENHKKIIDFIRRSKEWHQNLERVHGFTEAESAECFSRAGKYVHCDEFPKDAVNKKLFPHAKEGWILLKEAERLAKDHPQELTDLDNHAAAEGKRLGEFEW